MKNKTFDKVLIISILIIITTFTIALLALLIQTFNIDSGMTAGIIGGVLSMFGGMVGAFGAYLVASHQMNKQFEHDKKKEERQRKEAIEQTLKNLKFLNQEVLNFIRMFKTEFNGNYNAKVALMLNFSERDLQWIVNKVNNINHELLKEDYSLDYLKLNKVLNNLHLDIIGINYLPEEQREHNILRLKRMVSIREKDFKSFDEYVTSALKSIRKQIEDLE